MSSRPTCWKSTYSGMTIAIGGRIRCEISQNAMSSLASVRRERRATAWASNANTAAARDDRELPRDATQQRPVGARHAHGPERDQPDPRPIGEADEGVRRRRAQDEREEGAREADDDGVHVRPQRVVPEIEEDVAPGRERRLEVDERQVERAAIHVDGQLERRHRQPVQREEDDEGPADHQDVRDDLRCGRDVEWRTAAQWVGHQIGRNRRRHQAT